MVERQTVPIDLALQGGGSHGAFTCGVLNRLAQFGASSKFNAEVDFVMMLKTEGRRGAEEFLAAHADDIGTRSTADIGVLLAEC